MTVWRLYILALFIGLPALAAEPSGEGIFNKLLAPGPLMEGHKNLEHGDCLSCHDAGQGVPDKNCLTCHKDIAKSQKDKSSFHGKTTKACISCHTDHKGRNFDSTVVNIKTFNHNLTGFVLKGKHARTDCVDCHTEKKNGATRFFGTNDSCIGCHQKDDPHYFEGKFAKEECSSCHGVENWQNKTFDHKSETGYALIGDHAKLDCAKCHVPKGKASVKYDFPELGSKKCLTCHTDFHQGKLGPKFSGGACDQCHNQTDWRQMAFDHARTGFPLRGDHAKLPCASCHGGNEGKSVATKHLDFVGLSSNCASCHKDYHGFSTETATKLGVALSQCQTCHNETNWKPPQTFSHATHTAFPITGKHAGVKCFDCHTTVSGNKKLAAPNATRKYDFPELSSKTCETCHQSPHASTPPKSVFKTQKCSTCHVTTGWNVLGATAGGFDHNKMTNFPLTGDHAKISCKSCHVKGGKDVFAFANKDKQFCVSCHTSVHNDQFSPKFSDASCVTCHDTVDFKHQKFDHEQARFKLTGAHAKAGMVCADCHIKTKKILASKPPRRAGKFVFAHPETGFCSDCHKNVHASIKPKQFSSRFPTNDCRACHNVNKFSSLLDFDHTKTAFPIVGAHAKFAKDCGECHVKTKQLLATKPPKPAGKYNFPHEDRGYCQACHTDVHRDQFSKKFATMSCTECHTQTTFDKRLAFNHNKTSFKLTGAHAKMSKNCVECHKPTEKKLTAKEPDVSKPAGKYQFSGEARSFCEACHTNEHSGQFRASLAKSPCLNCHNTTDFEKMSKFDHNQARFKIHGKHKDVKCEECHTDTKAKYIEPPHHFKRRYLWSSLDKKDCAQCHKDPHQGQYGAKCSTCHTEQGWDATANFHKNFNLTGAHYLLDCKQCHTDGRMLTGMGNDCKACHQKDDVHLGSQPECSQCHTQQFWSAQNFHHSMTNFPLRGIHRTLQCADCHAGGVYQGLVSECAACHNDVARTVSTPNHSLPGFEDCQSCHNQFSFSGAR